MKVRNIVFSGFAAAILMGTAQAATTPFEIASKAYVDSRISSVSDSTSEVIGDMDDLNDGNGTNFGNDTDTVVEALNDLDDALNTKQNVSDSTVAAKQSGSYAHITANNAVGTNLASLDDAVAALESKVGNDSVSDQIEDALGDLGTNGTTGDPNTVEDALAGKVDKSAVATSISSQANASQDKWASEKAVADALAGVTGDIGSIQQQIDEALGDLGTNPTTQEENTVEQALALKQNEADSNVASGTYNYIQSGHGVATNLVNLDTQLKSTTDTANAAVPRQMNGGAGKALIFNENDGGGAKFEHNDGTWSYTGVNDGGANGIAAQIYALDGQTKTGTRIDVSKGAIYYTVGNAGAGARMVPENEIATKGDIAAVSGDMTQLNNGNDTNFDNPTDVVDALNDLDDAINTKADASDVGDVTQLTGFGQNTDTVVEALNELQANKLNKPIPNTCSADSRHCVLHMDNTGALSWVDITVPYVDGDTGGGASETPVEP